jgi:hypothetical protein
MLVAIGTDTAYAEEKKQVMLNIPTLLAAEADAAEGPKSRSTRSRPPTPTRHTSRTIRTMRAPSPGSARVQLLSGDSTSANKIYTEMLASPDKYTDMQLLEAGVNAARANRPRTPRNCSRRD